MTAGYLWAGLLVLATAVPGLCQPEGEYVTVENAILKTINSSQLPARIAGTIELLDVSEGSRVVPGQLLGKIQDQATQLQVERARISAEKARLKASSDIDIRLAQKRLAVADNELERAVSANQRIANTYPAKEVDRLKLMADTARIEIERAQYEQDLAKQELRTAETELLQAGELLERHRLVSSTTGVVVSLEKRAGEWVEPGTSLLEIVETGKLRIEGFLAAGSPVDGLESMPGMATVLHGSQRTEVAAKVTFVSPESNPVNGQVRVFLEIENPQGLFRPGMKVETRIGPLNR